MRASLEPVLAILGKPHVRFFVPVFQRVYAWTGPQCDQLLVDTLQAGRDGVAHFLGTMIYLPDTEQPDGAQRGIAALGVIDGQQRLTTLTLMLAALRDVLREGSEDDKVLAVAIDREYLRAPDGGAKLTLSRADAATLDAIVAGEGEITMVGEPSRFLVQSFERFTARMRGEGFDREALWRGLKELRTVAVELGPNDSPQQVFESLNAKGRPLTTADLLRNTLLMTYGFEEQERLFALYWGPIERAFRRFSPDQDLYIDAALHQWLVGAAPQIRAAKRDELYGAFKEHLEEIKRRGVSLEEVLRSLNSSCLAFAADPASALARPHLDWVIAKPKGRISQRKLFGD